jgi:hemerythrin-like metal-binding protein
MATHVTPPGEAKPHLFLPDAALVRHAHIDDDHRELIDILNGMLQQADDRGMLAGAVFGDGLRALIARAERHFRDEEAEMATAAYPELAAHKAVHAAALAHFADTLRGATGQADASAVYNHFNIVLDDLLRADLGFKSYLDATRRGDRLATSAAAR